MNESTNRADRPGDDPLPNQEQMNLPKIIQFEDLPRCGDEVWITSDGQLYRLRRTRLGKLILTK